MLDLPCWISHAGITMLDLAMLDLEYINLRGPWGARGYPDGVKHYNEINLGSPIDHLSIF